MRWPAPASNAPPGRRRSSRRRRARPTWWWPPSSAPTGSRRRWPPSGRARPSPLPTRSAWSRAGACSCVRPLRPASRILPVDSASTTPSSRPRADESRRMSSASSSPPRADLSAPGRTRAWPRHARPMRSSIPTGRWDRKITVDSATMMNKGLELIEAHHLFGRSHRAARRSWFTRSRSSTASSPIATGRCSPSSGCRTCARPSPMRSPGRSAWTPRSRPWT